MRFVPAVLVACVAQMTPQYPSPMSDATRPHPRVERYDVPGRRVMLSTGTVYVSPDFEPRGRHPPIVHLHGAPWLVEPHVRERAPHAVLVTVHLGSR